MNAIQPAPSSTLQLALQRAVYQSNPEAARQALLSGADPNLLPPDGSSSTFLILAVIEGSEPTTRALLEFGAQSNSSGDGQRLPLRYAVERADIVGAALAGALFEHGANPHLRWRGSPSPMFYIFVNNRKNALLALARAGYDFTQPPQALVDQQEWHGRSALEHAKLDPGGSRKGLLCAMTTELALRERDAITSALGSRSEATYSKSASSLRL